MAQLSFARHLVASLLVSGVSLLGCGGSEAPADAGSERDVPEARDDSAPPTRDALVSTLGSCSAPRRVTLTLGEPSSVTGDTAGGPGGPLTLGDACTNVESSERPPQDVIAVEVPGSGQVGVAFSLTEGTAETFDTVVEVRTACETTPTSASACFDDVSEDERRSAGAFMGTGGDTVYLVVSGYAGGMGTTSSGSYTLTIQADPNAPPTLTAASARRVDDDRLEIVVTGMDADVNVVGVGLQLLAGDGTALPLDGAAPDDVGPYFYEFDEAVTTASFATQRTTAPGSADFDGIGAASQLRLFTYDAYGARSATRDVPVDMVSEVGFGEPCDATHLCRAPNLCESGACVASAETLALCGAATAVSLAAPADGEATIDLETISLAPGVGLASGVGCEYSADAAEKVLAVTVPDGDFDLVATTVLAANPVELDTVLYVRSTCENERSELVCDDDHAGAPDGDYRSVAIVERIAAGTHYVFVDGYDAFASETRVALELRLRPVLPPGASCDPSGASNRCAMGACPGAAPASCP